MNVLSYPNGPTLARLGELGAARITFGSLLFKAVMADLADRATELHP